MNCLPGWVVEELILPFQAASIRMQADQLLSLGQVTQERSCGCPVAQKLAWAKTC